MSADRKFDIEPGYSSDGKLMEFSLVLNDHSREAIQKVRDQLVERGYDATNFESDLGKGITVMGHVGAGLAVAEQMIAMGIDKKVLIVDDGKDWAKELWMGEKTPIHEQMGLKEFEALEFKTAWSKEYLPRFNPYKKRPKANADKLRKKKKRDQRKARRNNRR